MQTKSQEGCVYRIHLKELGIAQLHNEMSLSYKSYLNESNDIWLRFYNIQD
jgi:hypothetical protein